MNISDRQEQESYGTEIALRFLSMVTAERSDLSGLKDVGEFLTNRMRQFIQDDGFDRSFEGGRFEDVFTWTYEALGESAFKRYVPDSGAFSGRFTVSAFEAVSTGLGLNYEYWSSIDTVARCEGIRERVKKVWEDSVFKQRAGAGKSAELRIPHMYEVGKRIFSEA